MDFVREVIVLSYLSKTEMHSTGVSALPAPEQQLLNDVERVLSEFRNYHEHGLLPGLPAPPSPPPTPPSEEVKPETPDEAALPKGSASSLPSPPPTPPPAPKAPPALKRPPPAPKSPPALASTSPPALPREEPTTPLPELPVAPITKDAWTPPSPPPTPPPGAVKSEAPDESAEDPSSAPDGTSEMPEEDQSDPTMPWVDQACSKSEEKPAKLSWQERRRERGKKIQHIISQKVEQYGYTGPASKAIGTPKASEQVELVKVPPPPEGTPQNAGLEKIPEMVGPEMDSAQLLDTLMNGEGGDSGVGLGIYNPFSSQLFGGMVAAVQDSDGSMPSPPLTPQTLPEAFLPPHAGKGGALLRKEPDSLDCQDYSSFGAFPPHLLPETGSFDESFLGAVEQLSMMDEQAMQFWTMVCAQQYAYASFEGADLPWPEAELEQPQAERRRRKKDDKVHDVGQQEKTSRRALLVFRYPREYDEHAIREAFKSYGEVDVVKLAVTRDGRPRCFGFVNFKTHAGAKAAKEACDQGAVKMVDLREVVWEVKADWAQQAYAARGRRGQPGRPLDDYEATGTFVAKDCVNAKAEYGWGRRGGWPKKKGGAKD